MPLDTIHANRKTAAINDEFAAIGHSNGSRMPASKRNGEPVTHSGELGSRQRNAEVAWEYHVASHALRIAEARKKAAAKAAVKAGIMFDPELQPMAVGTNALVYAGDVIEISVAVTTAATRLNIEGFIADLVKAGVAQKLIDKAVLRHTTENRAPHKFTSSLVTV